MAVTYYGSKDVAVTFGVTTATSLLFGNGSVEREAVLQDVTPFGVAWPAWLATGMNKLADFTFSGVEDFGSTTSRSVFAEGTTQTLTVTYGGAKSTAVSCIVAKYSTAIATDKLHTFTVTLRPTGTVTEA